MDEGKTLREVCNALGVTRRAVQGYEKMGLVSASDRTKYGHLLYDQEAQERIGRIRLYQQLGFQLKEIAGFIDAPAETLRDVLKKQIHSLRKKQVQTEEAIRKAQVIIKSMEEGDGIEPGNQFGQE